MSYNTTVLPCAKRHIAAVALLLLVTLGGCSNDVTETNNLGETVQALWSTTAADRGNSSSGTRFSYQCPAGGTAHTVWGTDVYTSDSSVCTAGVHAGKISLAQGGRVTIEMRPGQSGYQASTRNGVSTQSWGTWNASFVVLP